MRVLLGGATGFVGKQLCIELTRRGHVVFVLMRDLEKSKSLPFKHSPILWDISSKSVNTVGLGKIDAVVNLAGAPVAGVRWSESYKKEIYLSRSQSNELLAKVAKELDAKVLVSASAVGFYGNANDELLDETAKVGTGFLAEVCNKWESSALQSEFQGRKVAVRIGVVLGPNGGALEKMIPIFKKGLGGRIGSGKQWMSWIHIDDLVSVFCECIENENLSGVINGVALNPATNSQFTTELAKCLGTVALLPVPGLALKLIFGESASILTDSQRVRPLVLEKAGFKFRYINLSDALKSIL